MAVEFPENFPFNRKHPAVKQYHDETQQETITVQELAEAETLAEAEALADAQEAFEAQELSDASASLKQPARSKADMDFDAAIGDVLDEAPPAAKAMRLTAELSPAPSAKPITTGPAALSPRAKQLAEAVAATPIPAPAVPRTGRDRRRAPRQTLVAKATVRCESQSIVVASGFVSNISMSGVGFHTRRPLRIGEKYQLRIEVGPMKWASRLRIVSCLSHGDTYDVGAEFIGNDLAMITRRELAAA